MSGSPFDIVLVANRGEIAVRVMRACRELGVETVAVYSDADADAEHVRYADEAYNVGPARAAESYLDQAAIVDAAQRADADAIHPGYGFLAENAEFAAAVEETEGIAWVGPPSDVMRELGEKTNARRHMAETDVPIVPGTVEPVAEAAAVREFAEDHGYPVAIKAEGGGGGRGMKIVHEDDDVDELLESAKREGEAYFDNDSVYLERYLENPRHVEVQVLADHHGNVRHLGDRDCSLQRRHQKVIEEGPSPALSAELREQITDAARRGVDEAGYTNAGTVEFLVEEVPERGADEVLGPETDFYFLEVNTRIQVEHTVTEMITGIDIVKEQLRVACGEPISFAQDDLDYEGHAIEYRINAENAADGFQPASGGTLTTYSPPEGVGIRVDDAVAEGEALVTDYDSMVAKLIVWGRDRQEAIERSRRALGEYALDGVETIVPFHRLMLDETAFLAGTHTTNYIDEELDQGRLDTAQERWGSEQVAENDDMVRREFVIELDGERRELSVYGEADQFALGGLTGPAVGTDTRSAADGSGQAGAAEESVESVGGTGGASAVTAEMQGTILSVEVESGETIDAGEVICVLEAMKMENDVVADRGGTVTDVHVATGDTVEMGDELVSID